MTNTIFLYFCIALTNVLSISELNVNYTDAPKAWQLSFQDPATPIMEGIINLHHHIFFFVILIAVFVMLMFTRILTLFNYNRNQWTFTLGNATLIEIIWTIIPMVVLATIAVPSIKLLYAQDEIIDPAITIKAIGHQWYWSYEYSDYAQSDTGSLTFDSYMVPESDLEIGELRLLETDEHVVVPTDTHVRVIITSADVIHSWAVPSLGVKMDAIAGRLNQTAMFITRPGFFYGQCSEICGENHGFMPIVVEAVDVDTYIDWVANSVSEE